MLLHGKYILIFLHTFNKDACGDLKEIGEYGYGVEFKFKGITSPINPWGNVPLLPKGSDNLLGLIVGKKSWAIYWCMPGRCGSNVKSSNHERAGHAG